PPYLPHMLTTLAQAAAPVADAPERLSTWVVLAFAALVTAICVVLHHEAIVIAMRAIHRLGPTHSPRTLRLLMPAIIVYLLLVHLIEIGVFAMGYAFLLHGFGTPGGALLGAYDDTWVDIAYFSAAVYTTVGFGDITPDGDLRTLVAIEALAGLVLVTWSASFTFLVMQRYWVDRKIHPLPHDAPAP
ncbi:MAG: ion channel, partial [Planctomycetota bacterium]